MHFSIDRTVHTTAFDKPVVDHWLERKIAQTAAGSTEKDRSDDRPLQRRARYRLSYIPLLVKRVRLKSPSRFRYSRTDVVLGFGRSLTSVVCACFCISLAITL